MCNPADQEKKSKREGRCISGDAPNGSLVGWNGSVDPKKKAHNSDPKSTARKGRIPSIGAVPFDWEACSTQQTEQSSLGRSP